MKASKRGSAYVSGTRNETNYVVDAVNMLGSHSQQSGSKSDSPVVRRLSLSNSTALVEKIEFDKYHHGGVIIKLLYPNLRGKRE